MTTPSSNAVEKPAQTKDITDQVLGSVMAMIDNGTLHLPANYSPENALKAAYFKLLEVQNKEKEFVFRDGALDETKCTKASVANTLLKMIVKGWDVAKEQCYFIMYGKTMTLSPSYFGELANAKRAGLQDHAAHVIYEGDEFAYEISPTTKRKSLVKHIQNFENIDITKIKGAYVLFTVNGKDDMEIMNIAQIKLAWAQGQGEQKPHKNFTDQMVMKTVIGRMCKHITNTSDDSSLQLEEGERGVIEATHSEIKEEANAKTLTLPEKTEPIEVKVAEKEKVEKEATVEAKPGTQVEAGF